MKILMKHKEPDATWQEISIDKALKDTEEAGYWKTGTVKEMLKNGATVWTPFADYKLKDENK